MKKPNVLILYSDQHSARTLGCYGNKEVITPNLDKLADEGITMDNAFCNNPICTPSRMCMVSGQYAHNFGYYGLMGKNPENLPTLFAHFRKFGYKTVTVGKIHTPAGWVSNDCDFCADGYGFEVPITLENVKEEEGCQGLKDDDYARYLEEIGLYQDRDDKIVHEWYELYGHSQGQCVDSRPSRLDEVHSFENWCAQTANDFIESTIEEGDSFCMWLTMPRPHQTYVPARKFWDMYEDVELELPPNANDDMSGRSDAAQIQQSHFQNDDSWTVFEPHDFESARRRVLRGYYACVTQMDDAIGKVIKKLEDLNIAEDTIIVYMTDHGEFAGEHGMIEKAPGIGFSCVTQIPMIWKYKGCKKGERRDSIIESVNVFPTLCDLAGVELPNWVDGISATSLLENNSEIMDYAVCEFPHTKTIHTKQYKLTQFLPSFHNGKDHGELYDRVNDPWELNNLYFDEKYKDVINDLRYKLYCWLAETTRVYTVNPKIPMKTTEFDVSSGISWDLAEEVGACGEDGKIGKAFCLDMIQRGHKNYL